MSGDPIYFRQLELGPMQNYVYLIGDPETREAAVVDAAWDIDTIVATAEADGYRITTDLVTHFHPDHLVGMWKLAWIGPDIFWQVRGDGVYRLVGTGARPNEHWGRIQASNGKWSSEWEKGADGGNYQLSGNSWTATGALGTGTWVRTWPVAQPAASVCPYIDGAAVEQLFAGAPRFRMIGNSCEFNATRVGFADEVSVDVTVINEFNDSFAWYAATAKPAPIVILKSNA
jgi:hypothetical protein